MLDCMLTFISIIFWYRNYVVYGFQTHSSTEQAAFTLINSILTAMNNNQIVGGIFCDLQKAFDCVNHKILLEKLEFYGVEGKFKD